MTALSHLCEDEQDEDRLRPLSKSASSAIAAHMDLRSDRQRGPDPRALLDSLLAKMDLLRRDHLDLGVLNILPSDEAEYIPLVFENLMKFSDHAKQSTASPQTLELPDLEQYNELSAKVAEQQEQLDSLVAALRDANTDRRRYRNDRNSLREQLQKERKLKEVASTENSSLQKNMEELVKDRDHHRDLANRTARDLGVLRAENDYLTATVACMTEQRDTSRLERDKYRRQLEGDNVENTEQQRFADTQLQLSQYSCLDQENEAPVEEPPAVHRQRDRSGFTRQLDASREVARERKSAEMASYEEEEEEDTPGSQMRSSGWTAAAVGPRRSASSALGPQFFTHAVVPGGTGSSRPTITQTSGGIFTMSVTDAKAQNCTSDVIPVVALDALKTQIKDWIGRPADRGDWFRKVNGSNRVCLMMRVRKKKCHWENGEDFACKTCQDAGDFCVVAKKDGTIQLLPRKESDNQGMGPSDEGYWIL